ncbi:hypothetical protein ASPVEDRAFT_437752 [Aspergillus versicolor CBS 583.65]|uniref:Uncharacterized protein n=1 Tax=Aspergillus versicolor CBS 583.65 TaxID=1036611 RepID=A0A1L9P8S7_ASPVE|nr:uncharacterized protein ASPVEDRAFT_437752 [Aspergillus versicolor CBS 583.65]OJI97898.1 hypothetical protein ASPVEDRAFT_437752 [Aspergillus versicolor CBS 583.65]
MSTPKSRQKQTEPPSLGANHRIVLRICAWTHLYPKFRGCDWPIFPDLSQRSTNGVALVPGSRDTPLARSGRAVLFVYPCYGLLLGQGQCFYQQPAVAQPHQERHARTIEA